MAATVWLPSCSGSLWPGRAAFVCQVLVLLWHDTAELVCENFQHTKFFSLGFIWTVATTMSLVLFQSYNSCKCMITLVPRTLPGQLQHQCLSCFFRVKKITKVWSHWLHLKGTFSWCFFRVITVANAWWRWLHLPGQLQQRYLLVLLQSHIHLQIHNHTNYIYLDSCNNDVSSSRQIFRPSKLPGC